jgi:RNA polymerase sporulation-specific sigma factor
LSLIAPHDRSLAADSISRCPSADASDEELIRRIWDGDGAAMDVLLGRYRGFVRMKARSYFLVGADREDVVQEGMVGLYKAVRDFDATRETSFRGFAELCVVRQIITAIKTATRHKHAPLNSYVSIHTPVGDGQGDTELGEQFEGGDDPADRVVQRGEMASMRSVFAQILSDLEAEVLQRYLDGESYAEIADGLDRHVKSIDNAIQRIKRKLELHLASREPVG